LNVLLNKINIIYSLPLDKCVYGVAIFPLQNQCICVFYNGNILLNKLLILDNRARLFQAEIWMHVFKARKSVYLLLYQVYYYYIKNGMFLEVEREKNPTKGINSKINIHTSFWDFSGISYKWPGFFFAYWGLKIKYNFK
jgi:hypothetical protein